jgi:hypothetical protein
MNDTRYCLTNSYKSRKEVALLHGRAHRFMFHSLRKLKSKSRTSKYSIGLVPWLSLKAAAQSTSVTGQILGYVFFLDA